MSRRKGGIRALLRRKKPLAVHAFKTDAARERADNLNVMPLKMAAQFI